MANESYWDTIHGGLTTDPAKALLASNEIIYSSYSGVDIIAQIVLPGEKPLTLGELQTISYSMHRENSPVRFVGRVNPYGFVKGPRMIAGSLIFTVFNSYAFYRLESYKDALQRSGQMLYPLADMLPPFDIVITFSNETGSFSKMKILGVSIVDEGQTMSVDDMITEQTYCVDSETEALTRDGWKKYTELSEEDQFLTLNTQSKAIEWSPGEVYEFNYSGPMVHWANSRGVDALTTPNHRWVTTHQSQMERFGFEGAKFDFYETDSIPVGRKVIVGGGTPLCFAETPSLSDELVELIGWTVTEGSIAYNSFGDPYGVQIPQSEKANPEKVQSLLRIMKHFQAQGFTTSVCEPRSLDQCRTFYFGGRTDKSIGRLIGDLVTKEKTLTPELLCLLTRHQAELLFETLMDGDGHRAVVRGDNSSVSTLYFIQNPGSRVDGFQMLTAMLGRRTSLHKKGDNGGSTTVYNSDSIVHFNKATIDYDGVVWCPRTKNGTWMARRNGVTFWTGNTYMARGIQPMTRFIPEGFVPNPQSIEKYSPTRNTLRFL